MQTIQPTIDSATPDNVWRDPSVAQAFLEGVRGAIPLAVEQIDLLLRLTAASTNAPRRVLDVGCGDGILGRALMDKFPGATCCFADNSEPMFEMLATKLAARSTDADFAAASDSTDEQSRAKVFKTDLWDADWARELREEAPFDVVVSGFAIHHTSDERKRAIYRDIFEMLAPGGVFLHLEHVKSATEWCERRFDDCMVDAIHAHELRTGGTRSREEVAKKYYYRDDKHANILAPLEEQCDWLREIGFDDVDCYLKYLELALFGGRKPQ